MSDWHDIRLKGFCRTIGTPDDWFAPAASKRAKIAKAVCSLCPILTACGDYAREQGIEDGIWGGQDEEQRRAYWENNGGRPTLFDESLLHIDRQDQLRVNEEPDWREADMQAEHDAEFDGGPV